MEALGGSEKKRFGKISPTAPQSVQRAGKPDLWAWRDKGRRSNGLKPNVASVSRPGSDEQKSLWLTIEGASLAVHSQEAEGLDSMYQGRFHALEEDKILIDPLCQHEVWEV